MKIYLAELYTAKGDKVEAQKILDSIDMTQVKDPDAVHQLGDQRRSTRAGPTRRSRRSTRSASRSRRRADIFYYRARAYIAGQEDGRSEGGPREICSMAPPDARELADAKKLLEQAQRRQVTSSVVRRGARSGRGARRVRRLRRFRAAATRRHRRAAGEARTCATGIAVEARHDANSSRAQPPPLGARSRKAERSRRQPARTAARRALAESTPAPAGPARAPALTDRPRRR